MSGQPRRKKGTGTVQPRGNRWRGTVIVDGKRYWVYADTPEQCEEDLLRLRAGLKPRKRKRKPGLCRRKLHMRTPDNLYTDGRGAKTCYACLRAARERRRQRQLEADPLARLMKLAGGRGHFTSENVREYVRRGAETKRRQRDQLDAQGPPAMRVCRRCNAEKLLEEFTANKNCRWGRTYVCRKCHSQDGMVYVKRNAERRKAYLREYRKGKRDQQRAIEERWRKSDPERYERLRQAGYQRFKNDPDRWARQLELSRRYAAARRAGEAEPAQAVLIGLIDEATSKLPDEIREAVRQDLALRIELREVHRKDLVFGAATVLRPSIRAAWKEMPDKWATVSLDAPLTEDGFTLADMLADSAA